MPTRAKTKRVSRARSAATPSHASGASLEELLAFERLLSDLSARFANVAVDQVIAEIESALKQLLKFLGFDRNAFWEFVDEEKQNFLCSVAVEGVEPPLRGPVPADLSWFARELRAGRTVVIRSDKDYPIGSCRRSGIQSPRWYSLRACYSAACWRRRGRGDRLWRVPLHARMANRVHRAGNSHWRGDGPCTRTQCALR